jgi:asparagine synthase (glutamine-hydrolysing)
MRAAIGAIVNLDGGPVPRSAVARLAGRARLPAGGAPTITGSGEAGLLRVPVEPCAAPPAAEGEGEAAGRCEVVLDGTLDNRSELARELGLPPIAATPAGSRQLVAAAYERWGEDCASHLVGDFALLLWDRRERRLLGARDACGLRELFYTLDGRELRVASQLQMLVEQPALSQIDEEYVADFLAGAAGSGPATPWKRARRLEAGHALTVAGGRVSTRRWWFPDERTWPRAWRDGEAVERFRELFGAAIRCCLESGGRVWAELSGGLDSSSIVCLAEDLLRRGVAAAPDFATLTCVWRDSPQCDEREWSEAVVAQTGVVNHQVWCDGLFFDAIEEECAYRSEPHFGLLGSPMLRARRELLREHGVAVLLSGARAECVVLAEQLAPVQLADSLRRLRPGETLAELLRWHRGTHLPLANLLAHAVVPLVGRRRYFGAIENRKGVDAWVDKRFASRMEVGDRGIRARAPRHFKSVARQEQYETLVRSEQAVARGSLEWACEVRHPYLHRPLVELALAIPWDEKISPREGKLLLRRGMAGLLPETVRTRTGWGGPGADLYKSLARRWGEIAPVVESSLLAAMGFVDQAGFRRAAELARFGATERFTGFLSCLAFEYWLRAVAGGAREAGARRLGGAAGS